MVSSIKDAETEKHVQPRENDITQQGPETHTRIELPNAFINAPQPLIEQTRDNGDVEMASMVANKPSDSIISQQSDLLSKLDNLAVKLQSHLEQIRSFQNADGLAKAIDRKTLDLLQSNFGHIGSFHNADGLAKVIDRITSNHLKAFKKLNAESKLQPRDKQAGGIVGPSECYYNSEAQSNTYVVEAPST